MYLLEKTATLTEKEGEIYLNDTNIKELGLGEYVKQTVSLSNFLWVVAGARAFGAEELIVDSKTFVMAIMSSKDGFLDDKIYGVKIVLSDKNTAR